LGGAQFGATLVLSGACDAANSDCTWQMRNIMFSSARNLMLGINAWGGAANNVALKLHDACDVSNPDCTFTFTKGMLVSDRNPSLAIWASTVDGSAVRLSQFCTAISPSCTWQWSQGQLINGNSGATPLTIKSDGFAVFGAPLLLNAACNAGNADCVFSGLFARN
jgi:hypothetical protein